MQRRTFLATSALSYQKILGANERVRLGAIGLGNRGKNVMGIFQRTGQVEVGAVCEVYGVRLDEAQQLARGAKPFRDHRALLEEQSLDAVLIATPDHWHAEMAMDAFAAGKDVYIEKPLCRTRAEGPKMIRACRVADRICQVGMQQRSGGLWLCAKREVFDRGRLGKVLKVDTIWHSGPGGLQSGGLPRGYVAERPSNLDWARFLGPVKWQEWNPLKYFAFRLFLEFNGGKVTDFFTHWADVVHMFTGDDAVLEISSSGGVLVAKDGRTAPDSVFATVRYRSGHTVTFDSQVVPAAEYGIHFYGTEGHLFINRGRYEFRTWEKNAPVETVKVEREATIEHVENFLACIKSRQLPNGDIAIGHRSTQVPLLAVQAYLENRKLRFDPDREEVLPLA
ncbi:MAG: Gfo/Idh/MocA family oxidoreductase [Bryobacter sp.]|nr:Gfo/Idh/MocA family oxidoreductase [Bryobacter sp.]